MEGQISDDDLKAKLALYGLTDVVISEYTRGVYLKKLKQFQEPESNKDEENESTPKFVIEEPSQDNLSQKIATPTGYYGVAITVGTSETGPTLSPFYQSQKEALKVVKDCPGARFKKFELQEEAEAFSKQPQPEGKPRDSTEKDLSPLPSVKTKAKNKLRLLLEDGNVEEFAETVWSNPKYLIASVETPEIFHEGTRRNALHCAADCGQLDICKTIFDILESDRFWELVYPKDSMMTRVKNKKHLIDLYLNMQDGKAGRLESFDTPLHLASRKGHEKIVNFLMSFPSIDTTIRNNDGQTAADVACSRMSSSDVKLKTRIQECINNPPIYYIPVLRAYDNSSPPVLGSPCTREKCLSNGSQFNENIVSPVIAQAFAGPLSPVKAKDLLRHWKSPKSDQRKRVRIIKRSDPDRGLERVGRSLAHKEGIGWNEYWSFLDSYCDFSKPEGLHKLETYLSKLNESLPSPLPDNQDNSPEVTSSEVRDKGLLSNKKHEKEKDSLGPPRRLFTGDDESEVTLNEIYSMEDSTSKSAIKRGPNINEEDSEDPLLDRPGSVAVTCSSEGLPVTEVISGLESLKLYESENSPVKSDTKLEPSVFMTPVRGSQAEANIFITGLVPTKLDRDVLFALCDIEVDPQTFPHVHCWKTMVESFSEEEQKMWHTPKSDSKPPQRRLEDVRTLSPLVLSSPPPSSLSPSTHRPPGLPLTPQQQWRLGTTPTRLIHANIVRNSSIHT